MNSGCLSGLILISLNPIMLLGDRLGLSQEALSRFLSEFLTFLA